MKFIIGKKLEMTQIWKGDKVIPVTRIEAGPCFVAQVKDKKTDGYEAVQLGFGERKEKNIAKPQKGHLSKKNLKTTIKYLREFRCDENTLKGLNVGDVVSADTFEAGNPIDVIGISKGKGFQGVVKRHGFHGQKKTHGNKDQLRMSGSIGAGGPQHVFKGVRMGGRMGDEQVTVKNLEIVEVDIDKNYLYVKGAVPGARNGLVLVVCGEGELKVNTKKEEVKEEVKEPETQEVKAEEKAPEAEAKAEEIPAAEPAKEEVPAEEKK